MSGELCRSFGKGSLGSGGQYGKMVARISYGNKKKKKKRNKKRCEAFGRLTYLIAQSVVDAEKAGAKAV